MFYYNDTPRLLEKLLISEGFEVHQDSCLRGGATLTTLWQKGNGMLRKFGSTDMGQPTVNDLLKLPVSQGSMGVEGNGETVTIEAPTRTFVLMNDHTQGPTRKDSRDEAIKSLRELYIPLLKRRNQGDDLKVLLLQTPAYHKQAIKRTSDLGDYDSFTRHISQGLKQYCEVVRSYGVKCDIIPQGAANALVRQDRPFLWNDLYCPDEFHPSPHGTWMQVCILFGLVTGRIAPLYNPDWWQNCRYMQPTDEYEPLRLPTEEEAEYLRQVAAKVVGVTETSRL